MESTLREKGMKAIECYLSRRGMDVIETNWRRGDNQIGFIATDEDSLVFISGCVRNGAERGFSEEIPSREEFEQTAIAYLSENETVADVRVRFDAVCVIVVSESRALIRHHLNVLNADSDDLS